MDMLPRRREAGCVPKIPPATKPNVMRIHQLRMDSEEQRLDAADRDRRREREELHQADQRAQNAETQRIHAAEQKANQVGECVGRIASRRVKSFPGAPWSRKRNCRALLMKVDCLHARRAARGQGSRRAGD